MNSVPLFPKEKHEFVVDSSPLFYEIRMISLPNGKMFTFITKITHTQNKNKLEIRNLKE